MCKLNNSLLRLITFILVLGIIAFCAITYYDYGKLTEEYSDLVINYNKLINDVFYQVGDNSTAVTIVYYTNFSKDMHMMTLAIHYEKYKSYHDRFHPYWGKENLTFAREYITVNDSIINQIVETIKNQVKSEEEYADALLDFVQYKGFTLSIRYYPTSELKYPIETLVEMGGDCDTHAFLYATLMKAAGFKILLLLSKEPVNGQLHVAVAVHLTNPPTHSLPQYKDKIIMYNGEKYYFAETTMWDYRVGDLPPKLQGIEFYIVSV